MAELLTVVLSAVVIGGVLAAILFWWLGGSQPDYSVSYHNGKWRRRVGRTIESKYLTANPQFKDIDLCSFVQILASKQALSQSILYESLRCLARRHPLLRAKHFKLHGAHYFQEMDDFTVPFSVCADATWEETFEGQLLSGYDTDAGPLWRVVFLPNVTSNQDSDPAFPFHYVVVFGFHHAIIDGTSFMHLLEDLMGFVNSLCTSGRIDQKEVESLPVPLPLECFVPGLHLTWRDRVVKTLCRLGLASYIISFSSPAPVLENKWIDKFGVEILRNPTCEVKTSIIPMIFGPEVMRKLRLKCREHGTKVTGALQVVMGVALGEMLQDGDIAEETTISCSPTVSLRRLLPSVQVMTPLCCFSFVSMTIGVSSNWRKEFWSIARRLSQNLHHDLLAKCLDLPQFMGREAIFAEAGSRIRGRTEDLRMTSERYRSLMTFANVGDCSFLNRPDRVVRSRAVFAANSHHREGPIFAHSLSTMDDVLGWGVLYYPNITPKQLAQAVADRIKDVLHQILTE